MTDAAASAACVDAATAVRRVLRRWPKDRPLVALVSGPGASRWSRRSIFAQPESFRTLRVPHGLGAAEARRGIERELRLLLRRPASAPPSPHAGWIGSLSYDLGRVLEPHAAGPSGRAASDDRDWPLAEFAWCPDVLVLDHATGAATVVGDPGRVPIDPAELTAGSEEGEAASFLHGPLDSLPGRPAFEQAVDRCVKLIHAGDLFQANLARRSSATFDGSTRALAERAFAASGAWFGAYLETEGGRTVVSMSPELFLSFDRASRRVVTRPIKGTRPAAVPTDVLERSEKDRAELAMIVDLMRNDLGRVARIGSVRVDAPRTIESHPTVHHAVAEVSGTLRDGLDLVDLLAATFPPGSVTGAPKIRAMQVIDELEPRRRGPYCGATGLFSTDGSLLLNVAIRTMALSGRSHGRPGELAGTLDYWAGCGIVAESDPASEWDESVTKSEVLLRALGG